MQHLSPSRLLAAVAVALTAVAVVLIVLAATALMAWSRTAQATELADIPQTGNAFTASTTQTGSGNPSGIHQH